MKRWKLVFVVAMLLVAMVVLTSVIFAAMPKDELIARC